MTVVRVPDIPVALSTSSAYPESCTAAFGLAERLGYDGVEVMVLGDPVTQEAGALRLLAEHHGIPVVSVHAPTLLISQRVWGTDPWEKVDRSLELAAELDATTVVVHPPFRWQKEYAAGFVDGIALRESDTGIRIAVENMYPWRPRRKRHTRPAHHSLRLGACLATGPALEQFPSTLSPISTANDALARYPPIPDVSS